VPLSVIQVPMTVTSRHSKCLVECLSNCPQARLTSRVALQAHGVTKEARLLLPGGASGGLETGPGRDPERPWGLSVALPLFPTTLYGKRRGL